MSSGIFGRPAPPCPSPAGEKTIAPPFPIAGPDRAIVPRRLTRRWHGVSEESLAFRPTHNRRITAMAWNTPKLVEIALGGEINCYACARVK